MAFDDKTRNRLRQFVTDARKLLTEEFTRQLQNLYGLDPESGEVTDLERLTHLDLTSLEIAKVLRATLEHYRATSPDAETSDILDRIVREQAFTILNRLCALRLAEARDVLIESVARGYQSKGFQLYARVTNSALGDTGAAYQNYLLSIFDELAIDLPVLFYRYSPQGRLFPGEQALLELLNLINHDDLKDLWSEDETIGWIYQYFNSVEERKKMRDESSAPRNSRELAVRNQFFTPRYVVEFLTDNTLGRLWYEMTRGETVLRDHCRYLVRRPTEIFLKPDEPAPENAVSSAAETEKTLSQEELLRQPVYIPHRPLKDPRDILLLDPACGSMHFGLYAFDLFIAIYDEAWEIAHAPDDAAKSAEIFAPFITFTGSFLDKAAFLREVPRLIVEHNIHGIDIDPRAIQIAGLSLWLRAQRAWDQAGVKPADRPSIVRSNVVCAEPMPGEKSLLKEFVEQQFRAVERPAFAFLLERIFDRMTLAGEAGSLLRIEEEIRTAIAEARALARSQSAPRQTQLFPGDEPPEQAEFDLRGLTDDQFWQRAEKRIYDALEDYAEQAENGGGFQRRLFAHDAAQGFAFIDLCRKSYDVVVMNPPFGEFTARTKDYVKIQFPNSCADIYTCFVERFVGTSNTGEARLGVISNRTFLTLGAHTEFRLNALYSTGRLELLADLGSGVLDAMVEVAIYVISTSKVQGHSPIFFPIHETKEKAVAALRFVEDNCANAVVRSLDEFKALPNSPLAYWLPTSLTHHFKRGMRIEGNAARARVGLQTSDDNRFARLRWEVPSDFIGRHRQWVLFAKGGEFSPFYDDVHLVVNWADDGTEIKNFCDEQGKTLSKPQNIDWYFQAGLTYPWRTSLGFAPRVLPQGCIFAAQGSALLPMPTSAAPKQDLLCLLGSLNSSVFQDFISIGVGAVDGAARSYQVGLVQSLPWISSFPDKWIMATSTSTLKCVNLRRILDTTDEVANLFTKVCDVDAFSLELAFTSHRASIVKTNKSLIEEFSLIEELVKAGFDVLATTTSALATLDKSLKQRLPDKSAFVEALISYIIGTTFGRWDIRYATGERPPPELPDPFAPLPVCPPGMLQGEDGLPLSPNTGRRLRAEGSYPLDVAWDGILVDDPVHPIDLERCVRAAFRVLWPGDGTNAASAGAIEQEACELLGVPTLREWFRRPTGFFADHLKRYSKSRRKAPIYWPLSVPSGEYTLWTYYHRLTDQTLLTAVNEFVEPKIAHLGPEIAALRQRTSRTKQQEQELAALVDLEAELKDFREELLRIAKFWKPNLNDGVQITAAPLWRLFQHKPWQKVLKQTWEELEKGKYDWAHLAYSIWPDRVREKCKKDKSLAIAHGLEDLYVNPPAGKKTRKKKQLETVEVDD